MNQYLTNTARRRVAQIILGALLCIPGLLNSRTRNQESRPKPGNPDGPTQYIRSPQMPSEVNRPKSENPPGPRRNVKEQRPVDPPEVPDRYIRVAPAEELDGLDLRMVLCRIIEEAEKEEVVPQLPQGLVNCYKRLERGEETVPVVDLAEALPLIVSAVVTYNIPTREPKAPRPDAPANTANNAIVGPGTCDLSPVLQLLNLVKCILQECCDELEQDFRETWTILADITDSSTICCEILQEDFRETWTILADIKLTLTECCNTLCDKFEQTWTILADINLSLTECCADLQQDFRETWTILADINLSLTECCADLQQDFRETWTILADIQNTLTECCVCEAIPIFTSTTITATGVYCLANNITGPITIDSFDVVLDLNGNVVSGGVNGVIVTADQENVIIRNGTVKEASSIGILVNQGCTKIEIFDIEIIDCTGLAGIRFDGIGANLITDVRVQRVVFIRSDGLEYIDVNDCITEDCDYLEGVGGFGFSSLRSAGHVYRNCIVSGSPISNGIVTTQVNGVLIENCLVDGVAGDAFRVNTGSCAYIKDCTAQCLVSSGDAQAFTLNITPTSVIENCVAQRLTAGPLAVDAAHGFLILSSPSVVIKNCRALGLTGGTARGVNISNSDCVLVRNCEVTDVDGTVDTTNGAVGYLASNLVDRPMFESCVACNIQGNGVGQGNGFNMTSVINGCIQNCIANVVSSDAFILTGCTDCLVGESVGKNSLFGFRVIGGAGNAFFNNFAFNNGTNYSGVATTVVLGGAQTAGVNIFFP